MSPVMFTVHLKANDDLSYSVDRQPTKVENFNRYVDPPIQTLLLMWCPCPSYAMLTENNCVTLRKSSWN